MAVDKTEWVIGKVLARQAAALGDKPFMQFEDQPPVSFAQTDALANRVGNALLRMGVVRGQRVAVMLPNCLEYCYAWFGISRVGAVHVAINTAYRGDFLTHVLNNSGAELMIVHPQYLGWLAAIEDNVPAVQTAIVPGLGQGDAPRFKRIRTLPFDALLAAPDTPIDIEVHYSEIGAIMYTSGTTGPSKGVLMPHAHNYLFGLGEVENLRMVPEDVYYICMPLFHANAMLMQYYGALIVGCRCVIVPAFSATNWIGDIRKYGSTITNTLGVMNEFILRQPPQPQERDNRLRLLLAIPVTEDTVARFHRRFGIPKVVEGFGMTECNIPLYYPLDDPEQPGSCGKVYEKYFELDIVHPETDEPLPPGEVGELVVRPKEPFCFMQGYNAMPAKSVEAWRNFWFHTGDAARMDERGYFWYIDRIKDCIRRRGENISSYELEVVLGDHPDVAEAAALAVKSDVPGGEDDVLACLVLKPGTRPRPEEILDFCTPRMPHFAVPRYVEFVPELPKTPSMKVQKAKLRDRGLTPQTWDREAAGYKVRR
ncbi:MAG: AMP-binding protein [Candidatus Lambdaproteobacteria bacterium]|nr:AMP-binding protein [Candidatus Lambdaproteobacteria bacterium]